MFHIISEKQSPIYPFNPEIHLQRNKKTIQPSSFFPKDQFTHLAHPLSGHVKFGALTSSPEGIAVCKKLETLIRDNKLDQTKNLLAKNPKLKDQLGTGKFEQNSLFNAVEHLQYTTPARLAGFHSALLAAGVHPGPTQVAKIRDRFRDVFRQRDLKLTQDRAFPDEISREKVAKRFRKPTNQPPQSRSLSILDNLYQYALHLKRLQSTRQNVSNPQQSYDELTQNMRDFLKKHHQDGPVKSSGPIETFQKNIEQLIDRKDSLFASREEKEETRKQVATIHLFAKRMMSHFLSDMEPTRDELLQLSQYFLLPDPQQPVKNMPYLSTAPEVISLFGAAFSDSELDQLINSAQTKEDENYLALFKAIKNDQANQVPELIKKRQPLLDKSHFANKDALSLTDKIMLDPWMLDAINNASKAPRVFLKTLMQNDPELPKSAVIKAPEIRLDISDKNIRDKKNKIIDRIFSDYGELEDLKKEEAYIKAKKSQRTKAASVIQKVWKNWREKPENKRINQAYSDYQDFEKLNKSVLSFKKIDLSNTPPTDEDLFYIQDLKKATDTSYGPSHKLAPIMKDFLKGELGEERLQDILNFNLGPHKQKISTYTSSNPEIPKSSLFERCQDRLTSARLGMLLGQIYQQRGKYDNALYIFQTMGGEFTLLRKDSEYAHAMLNSGHVYHLQGNYPKALESYQKAKPEFERLGKKTPEYGRLMMSMGNTYTAQNNYPSAWHAYKLAERGFKGLGAKNPEYARLMMNMGNLFVLQGHHKKALDTYKKAIPELGKLSNDHPDYAGLMLSIGNVHANNNEYKAALLNYVEAIPGFKKLGIRNPDYARLMSNIGNMEAALGQDAKALEAYRQAMPGLKQLGAQHPDYGRLMMNMGILHTKQDRYTEALAAFEEAKLGLGILGADQPDYGRLMMNMGILYAKQSEQDNDKRIMALDAYQKAIPSLEKLALRKLGEPHTDYARLMMNLGNLYVKLGGKDKEACEAYEKAEPGFRELGEKHPHYGRLMLYIGDIYKKYNMLEKAMEAYGKAKAGIQQLDNSDPDLKRFSVSLNDLITHRVATGGPDAQNLVNTMLSKLNIKK
jgi:tetratricopeptide (TPR) repeat protein